MTLLHYKVHIDKIVLTFMLLGNRNLAGLFQRLFVLLYVPKFEIIPAADYQLLSRCFWINRDFSNVLFDFF